ncbi:phosphoribosyltransferase [Marinobacter zhejiangensis]|uniref:Predicted phosphoribosyltransferase n=1 Tax=Marinobacter zhejiangensis TaxID=488535 RepID=A0A1I4MB52_9GAMM|nr:phosphoribosyltransferase [Marinobacter zhejiangensis]SFM00313.1 Predicted phosphoribosyltransferase [Marinobacter zhejiangensis]
MTATYRDRADAGRKLATALAKTELGKQALVLALPRGGVPVAAEIARRFGLELDVLNVRKLGAPFQPELAMGAIAEDGSRYLNARLILSLGVSEADVDRVQAREQQVLEQRAQRYRGDRPAPRISGRHVILVDDGLATGATMHAAVLAVRKQHPARLTVAVPVAAQDSADEFRTVVDKVVCPLERSDFGAVGCWYQRFDQVTDEEVCQLLETDPAG